MCRENDEYQWLSDGRHKLTNIEIIIIIIRRRQCHPEVSLGHRYSVDRYAKFTQPRKIIYDNDEPLTNDM